MSENRPTIAIVGFGRMVEVHHLPHLRNAGWQVIAACDVTQSRRELAQSMGVMRTVEAVDDLLSNPPDAAMIATHSAVRSAVAMPLIERGVHLLIDKPLARTGDEAERLCIAAEDCGVLLSVFHNRRWDRDAILLRQLIGSGYLGEIMHLENRSFSGETAVEFGAPEFRRDWRITAAMGGGTLLDFGPHWIDQVLTSLGDRPAIAHVLGEVRHLHHGDADDFFDIHLLFENGVRATMTKSDAAPIAPGEKWFVQGTAGSAVYRNDKFIAKRIDGSERVFDTPENPPDLHRAFLESVVEGKPLLVTGRESLRVCRIMDAARRSSQENRGVDVRI